MSLYLGKIGREMVGFTLAHPKLNKAVSLLGGTLRELTGGRYRVGFTRAAYQISQELAACPDIEYVTSYEGNLMSAKSDGPQSITMGPLETPGNPLNVKYVGLTDVTAELKTPEGAATFLRKYYISPTGKIEINHIDHAGFLTDKFSADLYGSWNCFSFDGYFSTPRRSGGHFIGDALGSYKEFADTIEQALNRYPAPFSAFFPRKVGINATGGLCHSTDFKGIFVTRSAQVIHHELFHWFEQNNTAHKELSFMDCVNLLIFGVKREVSTSHDEVWMRAFASTYNKDAKDSSGYACAYGMNHPQDDRATVAGMLYSFDRRTLLQKLSFDPILKVKVEMITGCNYDLTTGQFTRLYTDEEMSDLFGIDGHYFYAKWSNTSGRTDMDAAYWNGILASNNEVTAETVAKNEKLAKRYFSREIPETDVFD